MDFFKKQRVEIYKEILKLYDELNCWLKNALNYNRVQFYYPTPSDKIARKKVERLEKLYQYLKLINDILEEKISFKNRDISLISFEI